jgi:hypothetical protein
MNGHMRLILASLLVAVLVAGAVVGRGAGVMAQEENGNGETGTPVVMINPAVCTAILSTQPGFTPVDAATCLNLQLPANVKRAATLLGWDGQGRLQPEHFAGVNLAGNHVHQMDPAGSYNGTLFFLVFVDYQAPVSFSTTKGTIWRRGTTAGSPASTQEWVCDTVAEDVDCVPGATAAGGEAADGVVVGRLVTNFVGLGQPDNPVDRGPGRMRIQHGTEPRVDIEFLVVGEPRSVEFLTLSSKIQTGVTDPGTQCSLPGDAAGFLAAEGTPQRAIVLGIARDIDGTAVTGAFLTWETDDTDVAVLSAPLTPTIDLGAFGFGAPNIICGTNEPGTSTVRAQIIQAVPGPSPLPVDPRAVEAEGTTEFEVVGSPANLEVSLDPAELACDGQETVTARAEVLDAAGDEVAAGNKVNFNVVVRGTADPITANTNAEGVATSRITPLAEPDTGVSVVISVDGLQESALISCVLGVTEEPPPPVDEEPVGITPPATGVGSAVAEASGAGAILAALVAAVAGALMLSAGAALRQRVRARV